uniref:Vpu protein n=1 Tax=Simian immunodeficiency virus TaxID=11723 RepID=J7FES4_SIV|nr:vpu protein [Simian immunodeficiency virus]
MQYWEGELLLLAISLWVLAIFIIYKSIQSYRDNRKQEELLEKIASKLIRRSSVDSAIEEDEEEIDWFDPNNHYLL